MSTLPRAEELVAALEAEGVRATTDRNLLNPPAVLVQRPNRRYDVSCGFTVEWPLVAVAAAAQSTDRISWATLDDLVDTLADLFDIVLVEATEYPVNSVVCPAYLVTWEEALE